MTFKEITLLSVEEYEKYKPIIPKMNTWWWLKTKTLSGTDCVFVVNKFGKLCECPCFTNHGGVRPALKLNLDPSDSMFWYKPEKLVGTNIKYGRYNWTILSINNGELFALCNQNVAYGYFHNFSETTRNPSLHYGIFDNSDIKRWLETKGLKIITS